eukprot:5534747-Pyramimonas_sp.AAC.1
MALRSVRGLPHTPLTLRACVGTGETATDIDVDIRSIHVNGRSVDVDIRPIDVGIRPLDVG